MTKLIYLTSNPGKVEEANRFFRDKFGFELEIKNPNFEVLEIQAKSSLDVVKFSAKYAADRLGHACLKSDTALYIDCLGDYRDHTMPILISKSVLTSFYLL